MLRRLSLSYSVAGLLESLLYVALDISECNPCISERHNEKKESKDLSKSPVMFLIALVVIVALKSQLGVDNEEGIDGYKARKANIKKCSTNSGVRRS